MHMWSVNFQKRNQEYKMGKGQSLWQMVLRKAGRHIQRYENTHYLISCAKISSKWIKDLNIKPET